MKIEIVLLTAFVLSFAAFGFAQSKSKAKLAAKPQTQTTQTIKKLGVYTNMRFTVEHQYGYSVELWQEKDRVFGLFSASQGLIGDTPIGLLEDAAFDANTGNLSFRARLSIAVALGRNKETPTRDLFEFKGVLKNRKIIGTLRHSDDSTEPAIDTKKKIALNFSKSETAEMNRAESYDEWKKTADAILAVRGPKW